LHTKKHLSFVSLRKTISKRLEQIPDPRQGNITYPLHDCFMSGFAMMFFQDPSLLQFQRRFEQGLQRSNLSTLFQVSAIPQDSQLRDLLDEAPNEQIYNLFGDFFHALQRGKHLELFRFPGDSYLLCLDGSQYFASEKIHCPQCLVKTSAKGAVRYEHQILQPVIVCPGMREVIPLAPEAIENTDGAVKQDCEINAAKRLVKKLRIRHPKLNVVVTADGLYSKQPFIEELKKARMSFILVAKPADHKTLYEEWEALQALQAVYSWSSTDLKRRRHLYEWGHDIPLNGSKDAATVHFFRYSLFDPKGVRTYHNSWVTDLPITKDNVADLVKAGRARWKVENECFNTLKNQGYHIEHNFGHGTQNLSMTFFLLNLLAFFVHQILQLTDREYQQCRSGFSSRVEFWNHLRCALRMMVFNDFQHLLAMIIDPLKNRSP